MKDKPCKWIFNTDRLGYIEKEEWYTLLGECPSCHHKTLDTNNFCPNCGRAMRKFDYEKYEEEADWGDDEKIVDVYYQDDAEGEEVEG